MVSTSTGKKGGSTFQSGKFFTKYWKSQGISDNVFFCDFWLIWMSLCNHELSVVCHRCLLASLSVDSPPAHRFNHSNFKSCMHMHRCPQYMHMKYLANVTYMFKITAILLFSLFASPPNMVRLRAFIIGTVMHLFWGYPHRRKCMSLSSILQVMNF